jgi:hypothetical protein
MTISVRMRWAGHVLCIKEMRIAYKILVGRYHLENLDVPGKII